MRQLDDRLMGSNPDEVHAARELYRAVFADWNENINRLLALAQRYFGLPLRDYLDYELMTTFVCIGRALQERIAEYGREGTTTAPSLETELNTLANSVYALNVRLIETIQSGDVGLFHPDVASGNE
jgi:hypothetical protein